MEEVPVCRVCVEPVLSSICPDCLLENINEWLDGRAPFVEVEINDGHELLVNSFPDSPDNTLTCVRCNDDTYSVFCPHCYIKELYHQLRAINDEIAEEFVADFDFDFEEKGYFGVSSWSPLGFDKVVVSTGKCESCENQDTLYEMRGRAMCRSCLGAEEESAHLWEVHDSEPHKKSTEVL